MFLKWLPWKWLVSRAARSRGFLDPLTILSHIRRFAQPSEVNEPIELLRAGMVFHARGLINRSVIQHNLDWVWPYWVERQFDPNDKSFVPRAFSITHTNMTHRNWTAIGVPGSPVTPIVDPRGLLTPHHDGWSIDVWILTADGRRLLPSRAPNADQFLEISERLAVRTEVADGGLRLMTRAAVEIDGDSPMCRLEATATADAPAWLAFAVRPYNPEGVIFVNQIDLEPTSQAWNVNGESLVEFSSPLERHALSRYREGDVLDRLPGGTEARSIQCEAGLATAAALFELQPDRPRRFDIQVAVPEEWEETRPAVSVRKNLTWNEALEDGCRLNVPDKRVQFLYEVALRSVILHSCGDAYPGPYTYKRFWFRDAAFILHSLLCMGFIERAERVLDQYPGRQDSSGFFRSQEGEWDSNGEALWILRRWCELTGRPPKPAWRDSVLRGAEWIDRKRLRAGKDSPFAGLFPAGFSAEHLGPNDYYYWDNFWGVEGLQSAAWMAEQYGEKERAGQYRRWARDFMETIERTLSRARERLGRSAMPAAPLRRLDSGAVGSLAAGYPLQLWAADDPRLLDTAQYLEEATLVNGGFFQEMIHSGINAYLTLHLAQVHLRAGDSRWLDRMDCVARLASPTGQWPEAIHPLTAGGCMGDGHHVWASAEWLMMIRNGFVREESDSRLVVGAGIPGRWLGGDSAISFGPAPTSFGTISIDVKPGDDGVSVQWKADWRRKPKRIEVSLPGCGTVRVDPDETEVNLTVGVSV